MRTEKVADWITKLADYHLQERTTGDGNIKLNLKLGFENRGTIPEQL